MLPIHAVLDELKAALAARNAAVLVAPPGAGKTTVVPLALLDQPWVGDGKIVMLEPRRLAARAAAARMAKTLGEPVGETVGFRVRLQSKVSARTRIEVVTEGVFTRMLQDDPALDGIAAVIFDEFHERSLDADLGLALTRDSQGLLREDLRLLVMSATLDGARISALLDHAPIVESEGRMYPVDTRYVGKDPRERIEDQVAKAVVRALASETGSLLVFLPGQGEIRRTAERLQERITDPSVDIAPLYGALDPAEQDRAIAPAMPGRCKVVLATSIAETSLTIEGVRGVIDSGLARVPRFDPAQGLTRLETVRVSRAAADQRRGRAGRTEPGVCWRLWDEPETRSLAPFARPEILEADLAGLALDLAAWGARDASGLAFLDPPPAGAFAEARRLLVQLQALDAEGALTTHGKAIARLPLPPRLAHMVLKGAAAGQGERAARIAAVLTEQGLGGKDTDLRHRLDRFAKEQGGRGRDAATLAARWAKAAGAATGGPKRSDGLLLAEAYPERIARQRGGTGEYRLANGRGVFVEPTDALAREPWLAVAELGGGAARDRVLLAAPLDETELRAAFADRMVREDVLEPDAKGRLKALRRLKLGEIIVAERVVERPDPAMIAAALLGEVRRNGLGALPWGERSAALRARAAFLRAADATAADLSDEALIERLDDWLAPLLAGRSALSQLTDADLTDALRAVIHWDALQRLDREVPSSWTAPTGTGCRIDYAAEGGPRVEVRAQELFGLDAHPTVAGVPLTLALLSPARRPIQVTKDLPGFWRGSWKAVRADLRGRYPRHPWPENPLEAPPTTRAKPRGT
ncbi:MAG: ATP-dependent helicase HrpB [Caulobacterales bacterium 68-7]|nr:ATP-dependent helicase HrpB [Caulobacterales bacterium]OJU10651.1 MAG: ATP-dependent helicase HrpB [Caulobacterales bacterium 68-7]